MAVTWKKSDLLIRAIGKYYYREQLAIEKGKLDGEKQKLAFIKLLRRFAGDDLKYGQQLLEQKSKKKRKENHHPSSIGKCERKLFFEYFEAPASRLSGDWQQVARSQRIFEVGDLYHVRMQMLFRRMRILLEREYPIWDPSFGERGLIGHLDAAVELGGLPVIVELKSIGPRYVSELKQSGPQGGHAEQLTAYMGALRADEKFTSRHGVPRTGIILYEDKGTQELCEFSVPFDSAEYEALKQNAYRIDERLRKRRVPDNPYDDANGYPCKWCEFCSFCYSPGRVKRWSATLPPTCSIPASQRSGRAQSSAGSKKPAIRLPGKSKTRASSSPART